MPPDQAQAQFTFYLSCDINQPVKVHIDRLCGRIGEFARQCERYGSPDTCSARPLALHCVAELSAFGERVGLPVQTSFAVEQPRGAEFGSDLSFPIKYRDLPHNAQLCLTVWQESEGRPCTPLGGSTIRLFSKKGRLKAGRQRMRLWRGARADVGWPPATPGKAPLVERGEMGRLESEVKRYQRGEMTCVSWLDKLAMQEIERLQQQDLEANIAAGHLDLFVWLPDWPHAVMYYQSGAGPAAPGACLPGERPADGLAAGTDGATGSGGLGRAAPATPPEGAGGESGTAPANGGGSGLILVLDPEVGRENPAELKAQKLARSLTRGVVDRDLKPDTEERKAITAILKYPPNRPLSVDDQALLWRFRWSLTSNKAALTKFLKCVDWGDAQEARQAAELMQQWARIDIADALELLSPDFQNEEVRGHAVVVLQRADDDELLHYLLQLVQALRYEAEDDSRLARFIVSRAGANPCMGVWLHWYLYTEWEDPTFGPRAGYVHKRFQESLPPGSPIIDAIGRQMGLVAQLNCVVKDLKASRASAARKTALLRDMVGPGGPLGELMHTQVPLPLDPRRTLLGLVPEECAVFKSALAPLKLTFRTDAGSQPHSCAASPTSPPPRSPSAPSPPLGAAGGEGSSASHAAVGGDGSPSPSPAGSLPPPSQQQQQQPAGHWRYSVIYKKGDDLRQDQLVVQMFGLMDRLLKRENLDLKLTPYRVLPTSSDDGLIECVPGCQALARVLADHRSITKHLAQFYPDPHGPFGLQSEVVSNFMRSCAGYCVMTYILGVGDRHLDNLMLTNDGKLFHIDFGYILGRDPKPFPPPMKLCREMVDAMGGPGSEVYSGFTTLCCEAYNILRKSSNLILSLFHLMAGAAVPDIRADPEKAMLKLQEKLRLDLDDEGAVQWMQQLISESATALMPQIMETTHRWAQYWR